jgi:iron(III) transport system permease protein
MIQRYLRKINDNVIFTIMGIIVPIFILLPIIRLIFYIFEPNTAYYTSLNVSNAIFKGILTTIELIIKVGILSSIIGFSSAYFMVRYKLRFSKIFNIFLMLPLAIPVYVAAYTYTSIFHHIPFLEFIFKSGFMMNGSVFIYTFFLYPYVYISSKSYLSKNLTLMIDSSLTLGAGKLKTFFKIILPLSRPIILTAVLFVLFETLSDFAVVEYYGVLSLSRYINLAWFSNGDFITASKFSVYILLIMTSLILIERLSRGRKRYSHQSTDSRSLKKLNPSKFGSLFIYGWLIIIILLSLVAPLSQMIISVIQNFEYVDRINILSATFNSLLITVISIILILIASLILATLTIYIKGKKRHLFSSLATIGYMVPSMVLALGIYLTYIQFDKWLYQIFSKYGYSSMFFTGTVLILIIAFFVKFFSISYSNFSSSYGKVDQSILDASRTLGENKLTTMFFVTIPMMKKAIISVSILLFIDMFKELTLVYSLRPFNFETLSTEVYQYAGNEMVNVSAIPSLLIIVLCGLLIVYLEEGLRHD